MPAGGDHLGAVMEGEVDAAVEHDLAHDILAVMLVDGLDAEIATRRHVVQHDMQARRHHDALETAAPALVIDDDARAGLHRHLARLLVDQPIETRHHTPWR